MTTSLPSFEDIARQVREFVSIYVHGAQLEDDTDLFDSGLVNSMFAMQLVLFVEKSFALVVGPADMDRSNFRSVSSVASFAQRRLATAPGIGA
jgi:methoxymalonate biosynthesis acyl carrier protein